MKLNEKYLIKQLLSEEEVIPLISSFCSLPDNMSMCKSNLPIRAVGIAAVSLVVKQLCYTLRYFRDQFDVLSGEIYIEKDFTPVKLQEHMRLLLNLDNKTALLPVFLHAFHVKTQNKFDRSKPAKLGIIERLSPDIKEIRTVLARDVLKDMATIANTSSTTHHDVLEERIRSVLANATIQLQSIVYTFDKAIQALEADLVIIDNEWLNILCANKR